MSEKPSAPKGEAFNLAAYVDYAVDSIVSKTMLDKGTGSITLFAFAAGQGLSEHTSPFDAVVHILDGSAEISIGGQARSVASGDMIVMPADVPHALHAEQAFKMLLIMIRGQ